MAGGLKPQTTAENMPFGRRISRRQWMLECAGLVALSATGCGRADRTRATKSTLTILYYGDERAMGPYWQTPSQFLMFLPLVVRNARTGSLTS